MLLGGYDNQANISNRLPMPVDILADTAYTQSISGETLQLYYWSSNVLTTDAGEAAGTVVIAKFAYSGLLDALGAMIGNMHDTSVTFTTGTVLTTEVACDYNMVGEASNASLEQIAADLTENMANGEYCIDYRNGVLYGKKATTGTSDTVAYKVSTQTTGGGTSVTASQDLQSIVGTTISAKNAAFAEAPLGVGMEFEALGALTTDGGTAGDKVPVKGSAVGTLYVTLADAAGVADIGASMNTLLGTIDADTGNIATYTSGIETAVELIDDTVATLGTTTYAEATTKGLIVGAVRNDTLATLADTDNELAPLQVNASGALYTLDSNSASALTALQLIDDAIFADDASFTLATSKVMVGGAYAEDPTSLTAVDAGDVSVLKTDLYGRLNVTLGTALSSDQDSISTQPVEPSNYNTTAYAASGVIKASAGTLYEIRGYSSAVAGQWIQVHDAAAVPADTAVPEDIVKVSADGNFYISYPQGKSFGTGIVWSNSSTGPTKTIGAADCWVSAEYL